MSKSTPNLRPSLWKQFLEVREWFYVLLFPLIAFCADCNEHTLFVISTPKIVYYGAYLLLYLTVAILNRIDQKKHIFFCSTEYSNGKRPSLWKRWKPFGAPLSTFHGIFFIFFARWITSSDFFRSMLLVLIPLAVIVVFCGLPFLIEKWHDAVMTKDRRS